jgi:hypothetical protein
MTEPGQPPGVQLTPEQARRLRAGVKTLRQALREIEALLPPRHGRDFGLYADFPDDAAASAIRRQVETIEGMLARLVLQTGAEPAPESARRSISAAAASSWATALDLHPAKFRQLGDVDPAVEEALAGPIEALAQAFLDLAVLADNGGGP